MGLYNKPMIGMLGLFLFSRFWFVNWSEVFFDSKEYLSRLANPNFFQAIISGHPPLHSGYVLVFWPVFQLARLMDIEPAVFVLLFQIWLSAFTVYLLFFVMKDLFGAGRAIRAIVVFALLPIYWICNETVMMETTYVFFFVASLYFLGRYLRRPKGRTIDLIMSCVSWVLAFLTHSVVIMWIPMIIYFVYVKNRSRLLEISTYGLMTWMVASVINAYWLAVSFSSTLSDGFYWLYSAKFGEHAKIESLFVTVLRYIRNWIVPLGYNFGWTVLLLSCLGMLILWRENKKLFWLMFLWMIPSVVTNQWWDSLLYGRHALIAGIPLAFLCSYFLSRRATWLLFLLLLVVSVPKLALLKLPIPYQQSSAAVANIPPGGLLIDSHFARPQTNGLFKGETVFVDEPGWDNTDIKEKINIYFKMGLRVYVTGQALSEPYGLFSGPYLHPLGLSYRSKAILEDKLSGYGLILIHQTDLKNNLAIYQVLPTENWETITYKFGNHPRRIDQLDPLFQLYSYAFNRMGRNL